MPTATHGDGARTVATTLHRFRGRRGRAVQLPLQSVAGQRGGERSEVSEDQVARVAADELAAGGPRCCEVGRVVHADAVLVGDGGSLFEELRVGSDEPGVLSKVAVIEGSTSRICPARACAATWQLVPSHFLCPIM